MAAFILASMIVVLTLVVCALVIAGDMMSDSPRRRISAGPVFFAGAAIAGLVLASHWMPAVGW